LLLSALVVLINVPWIVWLSGMKYGQRYEGFFNLKRIAQFTYQYFSQIGRYVFHPLLLLIIPVASCGNWLKNKSFFIDLRRDRVFWSRLSLVLLFLISNLAALAVASPAPFFRYLAPLIPLLIILTAWLVDASSRINKVLAWALIAALLVTGSMKDFLYEITHDYDGPLEGIVKYLNEHGNHDDLAAITYGDMPLKFYTDMKIIGGLTGEDLAPARQAKWVILRQNLVCEKDRQVGLYLVQNLPLNSSDYYERITLDYPDIIYENREDPAQHHFRTVLDAGRVVIYRKIN